MNRREFLKFSSLLTASAGLSLAGSHLLPAEAQTRKSKPNQDQPVKIGYLPILDASPLLVAHARNLYAAEGLTAEQPTLFRAWPQIVEAFLSRQVNVIHILFPTTIWLRYGRKFPAKIVAWNHTNGSALTVRSDVDNPRELGGQTVAVPFWYSIHNVVLQQILRQSGLKIVRKPREAKLAKNEVNLVVLPPPEMVSALASKSVGGYIVAEPFNAAAEIKQAGKILRFTGDVWKNHACCVVLLHEQDLKQRPEWTQRVVNAIVKSQHWMRSNREAVATILSKENGNYTPHPEAVLKRALTFYNPGFYSKQRAIQHPQWGIDRIDFQPYPFASYTQELVRLLKLTQVEGNTDFLQRLQPKFVARDLVDDSFVKKAIQQVGGPKAFELSPNLNRREVIVVA
jgi:NitT/TauT family transport system substrate-binding protein